MSRFTEIYNQHPIHDTVKRLSNLLKRRKIDDQEAKQEYGRLQKLSRHLKSNLTTIDGETISIALLTDITNHLNSNVINQLQSYILNNNIGHLRNANNQIDRLLQSSIGWVFCPPTPNKNEAVRVIEQFDNNIDEFANKISEDAEIIRGKNEELNQEIGGISGKLNELSERIEARRENVDNQLSAWQEQFGEAQERRVNEYSDWINNTDKELSKELKSIIQKHSEIVSKQEEELLNRIQSLLSEASDKHSAILELYELTAGDSVAAGHIKNAKRETEHADKWRNGTISFIVVTVFWLIAAYFMNSGEANWSKILQSFSVTGVLLYGAGYCAQQSTKHRKIETQNRRFALEMKAIDPYLQSLDAVDRNSLKKELSSRFFGAFDESHDSTKMIDEHAFKVFGDFMEKTAKVIKT